MASLISGKLTTIKAGWQIKGISWSFRGLKELLRGENLYYGVKIDKSKKALSPVNLFRDSIHKEFLDIFV